MGSRVVVPESRKLDLSEGDWLLVKKLLNHGEQQEAFVRRYISDPGGTRVNLRTQEMSKVTSYVLDWSLVGLDGKQMVIRDKPIDVLESFLNAIDPESFNEIHLAIEKHEAAMLMERIEEKKTLSGVKDSPGILSSPDASTVVSATSVN